MVGFGDADVDGASCISFSLLDNWLGKFWLGFVIELFEDVSIGGGHVVHVVAVEGVQGAVAVLAVDLDLERPTLVAKADGLVGGALLVVVDDVWGGRGAAVLVVDDDCLPNFVGRELSRLGLVGNLGWAGMLARVGGGVGGGLLVFSFDLHFEGGVHSSGFDSWANFFFFSWYAFLGVNFWWAGLVSILAIFLRLGWVGGAGNFFFIFNLLVLFLTPKSIVLIRVIFPSIFVNSFQIFLCTIFTFSFFSFLGSVGQGVGAGVNNFLGLIAAASSSMYFLFTWGVNMGVAILGCLLGVSECW